jgi:aldehyde dehydrogenase (NAD+)
LAALAVPRQIRITLLACLKYSSRQNADLDRAVDGGIFGSFFHHGQICMRNNRHLVHRSRYEDYVNKFTQRAAALKTGDPADPTTNIGPVINEKQKSKIMNLTQQSVEQGAKTMMTTTMVHSML